ncbi:MAG: alanine--tRNA ligase [Candidatus Vogelbacteria bacterium]|nr:alanine--tRNA ligase [Candidatus Vogelbacteria bacterium]
MTSKEIRRKYLEFFRERGHKIIPSAPIIPENDPTTLFVSSGMQPMVPYLLGQKHPLGMKLVNSQRSFRAEDALEVGDNRHTTFFEMLGNWSLGDYFKKEQITWIWEFLVDVIDLDPKKLYITVFIGDESIGVPRDNEAIGLWQKLFGDKGIEAREVDIGSEDTGYEKGMRGGRIFAYDVKKNWWSRAGIPSNMPVGEPGGPDSEIFYDFGTPHDTRWGRECHVNCDCGRFMEIGNNVFMQYQKVSPTTFEPLAKPNIDFGGGLERILAATIDSPDIFKTDLFEGVIKQLEELSGKKYEGEWQRPTRIIADHLRGSAHMIIDGVLPGNTDQGYILRRLLRRAVRYADVLGLKADTLNTLVPFVIAPFKGVYDRLFEGEESIRKTIHDEEDRFRITLSRGMKHFNELSDNNISGEDAFVLFTTYGFPVEVTEELAKEKGITVDMVAYRDAMKGHQTLSRSGAGEKFKGGLADHSEATVIYHTTHHLLLKALQMVLGKEVHQRGSNITAERLRIDFASPRKMTDDEKKKVEDIVNEQIGEHLPVMRTVMKKEDAESYGAEHEFNASYPEMVSVYSVGPKDATLENPKTKEAFSIEFCGGPHVANTEEIDMAGKFKIIKEEAVAAGIRRIKAILV